MANDPRTAVAHLPLLFKPHPWHGIPIGDDAPREVTCFIEIVPTDTVKYELDKQTGYLKVDRPQQFSNVYPCLYGFIPQTYCGEQVGAFCGVRAGRVGIVGDRDPMDICVLTEKSFSHGDIILQAIRRDVRESPPALITRLQHYFLTYKQAPGVTRASVEITHVYDRAEAYDVVRRSRADYEAHFAELKARIARTGT